MTSTYQTDTDNRHIAEARELIAVEDGNYRDLFAKWGLTFTVEAIDRYPDDSQYPFAMGVADHLIKCLIETVERQRDEIASLNGAKS